MKSNIYKSLWDVTSRRMTFAENVDFFFIVSGSERTFNFCYTFNAQPTQATLVRDR